MIEEIKQDAQERMKKSIDSLKNSLNKVRTGRAHASLLDNITIEYYGVDTPLNQVGNVSVPDARTIAVTVFDKSMISAVEKAIMSSDLGLNPSSQGTLIRIPLPPLTEERRKDLVKVVKGEGENGKIAIRNIRRDANSDIKSLNKEKEISDDEMHQSEDEVQKITDIYIKQVDEILADKEAELMEI
ncbi:ribosome recycling factor [Thalassotalea sp. 1_MG-2023]|uniref:ribosome recycling factor n=1 Tax=Thalassotalea sp. 1_MG-2023 TaxID=3062680 RepID=UPI0026E183ED|nr:ribosome recycling factor [Thalassotalea sp. 1_MG-2023]MDO6426732.1 ribosome recycling factor [Thalassotalea sp. 1_MG-2023]